MNAETLISMAIVLPLVHAGAVALLSRPPGLRDVAHIVGAVSLALVCALLLVFVGQGGGGRIVAAEPLPGLELAFSAEPLGAVFAAVAAGLGALCALYTVGWMRLTRDPAPARAAPRRSTWC